MVVCNVQEPSRVCLEEQCKNCSKNGGYELAKGRILAMMDFLNDVEDDENVVDYSLILKENGIEKLVPLSAPLYEFIEVII